MLSARTALAQVGAITQTAIPEEEECDDNYLSSRGSSGDNDHVHHRNEPIVLTSVSFTSDDGEECQNVGTMAVTMDIQELLQHKMGILGLKTRIMACDLNSKE